MNDRVDIVIVGAGPAGMAAAIKAKSLGARSVVVLDEQAMVGGQIWRNVGHVSDQVHAILGPDYSAGQEVATAFSRADITHIGGATVWNNALVELSARKRAAADPTHAELRVRSGPNGPDPTRSSWFGAGPPGTVRSTRSNLAVSYRPVTTVVSAVRHSVWPKARTSTRKVVPWQSSRSRSTRISSS